MAEPLNPRMSLRCPGAWPGLGSLNQGEGRLCHKGRSLPQAPSGRPCAHLLDEGSGARALFVQRPAPAVPLLSGHFKGRAWDWPARGGSFKLRLQPEVFQLPTRPRLTSALGRTCPRSPLPLTACYSQSQAGELHLQLDGMAEWGRASHWPGSEPFPGWEIQGKSCALSLCPRFLFFKVG